MAAYEIILHPQAWTTLAAVNRQERHRLRAILDDLAIDPFRSGDFQQRDIAGRRHEVVVFGDWLVTFWVDHAVREIRIVALESVED